MVGIRGQCFVNCVSFDKSVYGTLKKRLTDEDRKRKAVLLVPFIVALEEKNVLINSLHPNFKKLEVSEQKDVIWGPRLFHSEIPKNKRKT